MIEFIVIYPVRTNINKDFEYITTDEFEEFDNLPLVERFVNNKLRRNKWMKPADFRVYSARRATITTGGKPVETQPHISSRC